MNSGLGAIKIGTFKMSLVENMLFLLIIIPAYLT